MDNPKVSIIVPIYRVEEYIERCAESLFAQTFDDIEYIFVDDCSPDKSVEILQRTLEKYPHRKRLTRIERLSSCPPLRECRVAEFVVVVAVLVHMAVLRGALVQLIEPAGAVGGQPRLRPLGVFGVPDRPQRRRVGWGAPRVVAGVVGLEQGEHLPLAVHQLAHRRAHLPAGVVLRAVEYRDLVLLVNERRAVQLRRPGAEIQRVGFALGAHHAQNKLLICHHASCTPSL